MPLTSPGNDDDTGENHQPTLRKNTAEPVEQTLKQNIEGTDSVIRNVKRRARGFRDMDHSATMIYLTCGRLDPKAVTTT
mgnify:FL=1